MRKRLRPAYIVAPAFVIFGYLTFGAGMTWAFVIGIAVGTYGALVSIEREDQRRAEAFAAAQHIDGRPARYRSTVLPRG